MHVQPSPRRELGSTWLRPYSRPELQGRLECEDDHESSSTIQKLVQSAEYHDVDFDRGLHGLAADLGAFNISLP